MAPQTIFEHPLNERVRTFLRVEHLFEKIDFFVPQYDPWATRVAVEALMELAAITSRADMKGEILKELERNQAALNRVASQPGVDPATLHRVLGDLERAASGLQAMTSPIGQSAREDELLKAVAQRSSIPGGACSFDLPSYHHWLVQNPERRQSRLEHWLQDLRPADFAIRLVLSLARTSCAPATGNRASRLFSGGVGPAGPGPDGARRSTGWRRLLSGDQRPQEPLQYPLQDPHGPRSCVPNRR